MAEVVDPARHRAEELLVARLERAEGRRIAQVPFADQRGAIAIALEQPGQGEQLEQADQRQVNALLAQQGGQGMRDQAGGQTLGAVQRSQQQPGGPRRARR